MWNKLRNVIVGAALFKKAGKKNARKKLSLNTEALDIDGLKNTDLEHLATSRSSLDSTHSQDADTVSSDCK